MNKKIDDIIKYGVKQWVSPRMTSDAQGGYSIIGSYGFFNDTYTNKYYGGQTGTLLFPTGTFAFINSILVPSRNSTGYPDYFNSTYFSMALYYQGVEVYTATYTIQTAVETYYTIPFIKTDKIFHGVGHGAAWEEGTGEEDTQVGKRFYGITNFLNI